MFKKSLCVTILLALFLGILGTQPVRAEESYDVSVSTYKEFYDAIKDSMMDFKDKISIKVNNYDSNIYNYQETMNQIIDDYPEIYYHYGDSSAGIRSYYSFQTHRIIDIYFRYRGSKDELNNLVEAPSYMKFKEVLINRLDAFDENLLIKIYNYDELQYDISNEFFSILSCIPDLDYGVNSWNSMVYGSGEDRIVELHISYSFSKEKMAEMKEAVDVKAKEIINKVIKPEMKDYEKELALHDYIINNAEYNTEYMEENAVPEDEHTPYGVLVKGKGVCSSYAKAMHKLLNMVGIESMLVTGTGNGEPHAWNIVKVQGRYYHLDVTWDDPVSVDGEAILTHDYFNLTDIQMSNDHSWSITDYPQCDSTLYSYSNIEKILSGNLTLNGSVEDSGDKSVEELPNDTIVIGDKAFSLDYANNLDNIDIVYGTVFQEGTVDIFIKINDKWLNSDGSSVNIEDIPDVEYTNDGFNYITYNSIEGDLTQKDIITVTVNELLFGEEIIVDIEIIGEEDYPTLSKYSISEIDTIENIGNKLYIFPSKSAGDVIQVQLYTVKEELIDTVNLVISEYITEPTNFTATAISDSEIQLYWDKVEDADYYYVYKSYSLDGEYKPYIDENGEKRKLYWYEDYCINVYDVEENTTLYFKVTAVKDGIESEYSNIVYATTFGNTSFKCLEIVQNGYLYDYKSAIIKKAFEGYFDNPTWIYFKSQEDDDVVEFTGESHYNNQPVTILIQFTVDALEQTFYINYKGQDGEELSFTNWATLLNSIYGE